MHSGLIRGLCRCEKRREKSEKRERRERGEQSFPLPPLPSLPLLITSLLAHEIEPLWHIKGAPSLGPAHQSTRMRIVDLVHDLPAAIELVE